MARTGQTRNRIMDAAQDAVLAKGFGATSIEEIVAAAEITRSGFFYHFPDKNALARALLERYLVEEETLLDQQYERARELNDDPLHALLVGLKLFAEMMEDLPNGHPGCLVATMCYQDRLFDAEVHALNKTALENWRRRFRGYFEEIAQRYPPREKVDLDDLADMVTCISEGGIVMSKALRDPAITARQVMLLRNYIKLLFAPGLN